MYDQSTAFNRELKTKTKQMSKEKRFLLLLDAVSWFKYSYTFERMQHYSNSILMQ